MFKMSLIEKLRRGEGLLKKLGPPIPVLDPSIMLTKRSQNDYKSKIYKSMVLKRSMKELRLKALLGPSTIHTKESLIFFLFWYTNNSI